MTRREAIRHISSSLTPLYPEPEARQIAYMVVEELSGLSRNELLVEPDQMIEIPDISHVIEALKSGRPVQYIIGKAWFCGLEFAVRSGVLIPRPETEELVAWIIEQHPQAQRILDIGTGSGAIAIALKHNLPQAELFATDISDIALDIAAENSKKLKADITLRKADALQNLKNIFPEQFDIIVSNPPYIPQSDIQSMHINVKDFEPSIALFVEDDDPLKFYRAIARDAQTILHHGGALYFEIYEHYADQIRKLLAQEGFIDIRIRRDINEKERMVCCRKL